MTTKRLAVALLFLAGADVVDVLATDVYQKGFAADDYEQLLALAGDKPVALGEVGRTPTVEILHHPVLE